MKIRNFFALLLILVLILGIWLLLNMKSRPPGPPAPMGGLNTLLTVVERQVEMGRDIEHSKDEWRTPISFYGKVVDETNKPVEGATVDFSCNDLSVDGTSFYHSQSDALGLFSIKGIRGKLLVVKVTKTGYYSYLPSGDGFYYAGQNQNFVPDSTNPVIFRLRSRGPGENLIHFNKSFRVPKEGTPIQIDLATGNLVKSGQSRIQVECWAHDSVKKQGWKYDWKCGVSVPGGGLQLCNEQFPFLAPGNDYIAADTIDMTVEAGTGWSPNVKRQYYVRTADGKYGRVVFEMIAGGDHFCQVNSFFNPSGSRNLEPAQ